MQLDSAARCVHTTSSGTHHCVPWPIASRSRGTAEDAEAFSAFANPPNDAKDHAVSMLQMPDLSGNHMPLHLELSYAPILGILNHLTWSQACSSLSQQLDKRLSLLKSVHKSLEEVIATSNMQTSKGLQSSWTIKDTWHHKRNTVKFQWLTPGNGDTRIAQQTIQNSCFPDAQRTIREHRLSGRQYKNKIKFQQTYRKHEREPNGNFGAKDTLTELKNSTELQ